jgi:hypothetical protein
MKRMSNAKKRTERERKLRIAYEALDECNKLHDSTNRNKIPLDEVAENLGISKEEIQQGFDLLAEEGIISDDGDRNHMNYSDAGFLMEIIAQLLLELARQKEEEEEEEKEDEVVQYIE